MREADIICPARMTLTFDFLISKVVSELPVTWATAVPILVFLGFSVLDLVRCTRQTSDVRQHHRLMPQPRDEGKIKFVSINSEEKKTEKTRHHRFCASGLSAATTFRFAPNFCCCCSKIRVMVPKYSLKSTYEVRCYFCDFVLITTLLCLFTAGQSPVCWRLFEVTLSAALVTVAVAQVEDRDVIIATSSSICTPGMSVTQPRGRMQLFRSTSCATCSQQSSVKFAFVG